MRRLKSLGFVAVLAASLAAPNTPASAISRQKWSQVCTGFLGIRSAETQKDTNGAGYGMDNGNTEPMACVRAAHDGWDRMLEVTVDRIKSFANSGDRYLLLVTRCPGQSADYEGTFPKCNRVGGNVLAATPNTLSHYTTVQLAAWVIENIPTQ